MEFPEIDVERLDPVQVSEFARLEVVDHPRRIRHGTVRDALPAKNGLSYCCLIAEAYVDAKGGSVRDRVEVLDFPSLFKWADLPRSAANLGRIRLTNVLLEGGAVLDPRISNALRCAAQGSQTALVRCEYNPELFVWRVDLTTYLNSPDLLMVLPNVFGRFTVVDAESNWVLRLWDDDPMMLFAADAALADALEQLAPDKCIQVPTSMSWF